MKKPLLFLLSLLMLGVGNANAQLHSATDSVMPPSTNTVTDWGRGFRFSPNQNLWLMKFGKYVPGSGSYVWVLWDVQTQTKVHQQTSLVNSPNQYSYEDADSVIPLISGRQYILELYGIGSAMYYYGTTSQIGQHLTYYDMMYCSCGPNTYPNTTLTNYHYGVPDFLYSLDPPNHPDDAGVDSLLSPDVSGEFCSGKQEIKIRMQNFGTNKIDSLKLHWSLNGVRQPDRNFIFNPQLDSVKGPNHSRVVSLGFFNFDFMQPMRIKVWTSMPNGVVDTANANDTLYRVVTSVKQGATTDIQPKNPVICEGSSVVLDAGTQAKGTIFIWNNGSITQKTLANRSGRYDVLVQSATGCMDWDTVYVGSTQRPIAGDFGIIDLGGDNFEFTPTKMQNIKYYRWEWGDSSVVVTTTSAKQQHRYKKPGTYIVNLVLGNECDTLSLLKQIFVHPQDGSNTIINNVDDKEVRIYPNPTSKVLNVVSMKDNMKLNSISIYNVKGQKVLIQNIQSIKAQINVSSLAAGVYQVLLQTDQGTYKQKVEILK